MLIAHLPSGYVVGAFGQRACPAARGVLAAALVGSVLPDVDMIWFHLVDGGRTHHHAFVTHWPLFWAAVSAILMAAAWAFRPRWRQASVAFAVAVQLHMILDSVAAPMTWLAPFSDVTVELARVPAIHPNWIVSFLLHWTFLIELAICALAAALWLARPRQSAAEQNPPR